MSWTETDRGKCNLCRGKFHPGIHVQPEEE